MSRTFIIIAVAVILTAGLGVVAFNPMVAANSRKHQDPEEPKILELAAFQNAITKAVKARTDKESQIEKLMRERTECAQRELELRVHEFSVGRGTQDVMLDCARNAKNSAIELAVNKEQELEIRLGYQLLMQYVEKLNEARFANGAIKQQDLEAARFARIDAQIQYLKAGGK
jgi:hypothetical protein